MIEFGLIEQDNYVIVSIVNTGIVKPSDLKLLSPPDPVKLNFTGKGVILSGRDPIWLYGFLIHFYHPAKFVATYDPRLSGAVIVESHSSDYVVGDVINIDTSIIIA